MTSSAFFSAIILLAASHQCSAEPETFTKLDCLVNTDESGLALSGYEFTSEQMTQTLCVDTCAKKSFEYAGLKHGTTCYCDHDVKQNKQSAHCTEKCSDGSECGGTDSVTVLATQYYRFGCYFDAYDDEPYLKGAKTSSDDMNFFKCLDFCFEKGFKELGVRKTICTCDNANAYFAEHNKLLVKQNKLSDCDNCTQPKKHYNEMCGYKMASSLYTIRDEDECAVDNGGCDADCTNTLGSFTCSCGEGFKLADNGKTCSDEDECAENNGGCDGECTNTEGSFTCSCGEGFKLADDGKTCSDEDECADNNGGCTGECTNTVGSFTCSCGEGLELADDGKTCSAPSCPEDTAEFKDKCYMFMNKKVKHDQASSLCEENGGTLATVDNAINKFISEELKRQKLRGNWWIGLQRSEAEGGWEWTDGAATDFRAWRKKHRNCAAVTLGKKGVKWLRRRCSSRKKIICAIEK